MKIKVRGKSCEGRDMKEKYESKIFGRNLKEYYQRKDSKKRDKTRDTRDEI